MLYFYLLLLRWLLWCCLWLFAHLLLHCYVIIVLDPLFLCKPPRALVVVEERQGEKNWLNMEAWLLASSRRMKLTAQFLQVFHWCQLNKGPAKQHSSRFCVYVCVQYFVLKPAFSPLPQPSCTVDATVAMSRLGFWLAFDKLLCRQMNGGFSTHLERIYSHVLSVFMPLSRALGYVDCLAVTICLVSSDLLQNHSDRSSG